MPESTIIMTKAANKLEPALKKKAYAFLEKLAEDDSAPGLHVEPIKNSADKRVRTGRVDQGYRAVLFKLTEGGSNTYVFHGIWPHDDAIAVAGKTTLTVNPVNDAPTLNGLNNLSIAENAGLQTVNLSGIGTGAPNETQTLTITATSSNPGVVPDPTVNYISPNATGSLTFTPVANSTGVATITVTVNDGQAANNTVTRNFTVRVALDNPPEDFRFGSAVRGTLVLPGEPIARLPLTALFNKGSDPAVWVVDPQSSTTRLVPVTVQRFEARDFLVANGVSEGDRVVVAGAQQLRPAMPVRLLEGSLK